jgi:GNAT superfamily N-acetyltransferase
MSHDRMSLSIARPRDGAVDYVRIRGDVDLSEAEALHRAAAQLRDGAGGGVCVDLGGITFMDSTDRAGRSGHHPRRPAAAVAAPARGLTRPGWLTGWVAAAVRLARATDAEQVAAVHVAAWQWAYAGLLPAEELAELSVADRADRWRTRLAGTGTGRTDRGATYVADLDGRVVGFVTVGPGRDDVGGPSVGELYAIYLQREVAGTGTGRRLHDAGVEWLAGEGWTRALLWVLRDNVRARRFYELCGWRADGVTKSVPRPDLVDLDEVRYERALLR